MTYKRFNYLLLSIIAFLIALLLTVSIAYGQAHVGIYGTGNLAGDMGFDSGPGLSLDASVRWQRIGLYGMADYINQHKSGAKLGYKYRYGAQARGYIYKGLYILSSVLWVGYRSEFESGSRWEKQAQNPGVGAGYEFGKTDLNIAYYFREYKSQNDIEYVTFKAKQQIKGKLYFKADVKRQTFGQVVDGTIERWSGWSMIFGFGMQW
jgi:hypothetical protein